MHDREATDTEGRDMQGESSAAALHTRMATAKAVQPSKVKIRLGCWQAGRGITWLDVAVDDPKIVDVLQASCNVEQHRQQRPQRRHDHRPPLGPSVDQCVHRSLAQGLAEVACKHSDAQAQSVMHWCMG